jgi:phospholipid-binding lipoprotein MlaA
VGGLDERANAESDLQQIDEMGTDSYATMRSLYLQNRQAQVEDKPIDIQNLPDFDQPGGVSADAAPAPGAGEAPSTDSQAASAPQPETAPAPQAAPVQPPSAAPGPSAMLDGPITTAPGFELAVVRS